MAKSARDDGKRKWLIGSVVAVVILAAGYFAWGAFVPKQTEADRILADVREVPVDQRFEKMRELRKQERDLPEEEREKVREGMHEMMAEEISKRIDEYENAPEDQKVAVLDKQIDEFVAMRERWRAEAEQRRAEGGEDGDRGPRGDGPPGGDRGGDATGGSGGSGGTGGNAAAGSGGGPSGGDGARAEGRGGRAGGRGGQQTIEQRKRRMEGTNPDRMARMMRYFTKVRERAAERGIDMGGPGGRGPGGGGGPRG